MGGGCHPENFYKFVVHKTESRKYPFSGIGLVRENPNDTIEIFYSNATEQEGVNEVLTAKFATDTIVGMNEVWIKVDFGKQFGRELAVISRNYTKNGGQYFKICNRGKGNLFYFILPSQNICDTQYKLLNDNCVVNNIMSSDDKSLYDMLFPNGVYDSKNIRLVAKYFKDYIQKKDILYLIPKAKSIYDYVPGTGEGSKYVDDIHNRLDVTLEGYADSVYTNKGVSKGFIYPNECLSASNDYLMNTHQ